MEQIGFGSLANSILLTILGGIVAFVVGWLKWRKVSAVERAKVLAAENTHMLLRLSTIETQLVMINQVVGPINAMMQQLLIQKLTHSHTPEMDELMVKFGPPSKLTRAERSRLIVLLLERSKVMSDPLISSVERVAAVTLLDILESTKGE